MEGRFKILGIDGSPRKANTDLLLATALESVAEEGFDTETIFLRKLDIRFCQGCFKCFDQNDNEFGCQVHRDSMDELFFKLKTCHGLVLATPVYFGQVTGQMKVFMDRTEPLLRYASGSWRSTLKDKVGAGLVVGGNRHGGQETTLQAIHHFFLIHDMVVVGTGSDDRPGCYLGAAATTHPQRGRILSAVKDDELGLNAARLLSKRLAGVVRRHFGQL
jgi:multimeric flavodoxin WrbA